VSLRVLADVSLANKSNDRRLDKPLALREGFLVREFEVECEEQNRGPAVR
jgi:hypothetical protein